MNCTFYNPALSLHKYMCRVKKGEDRKETHLLLKLCYYCFPKSKKHLKNRVNNKLFIGIIRTMLLFIGIVITY